MRKYKRLMRALNGTLPHVRRFSRGMINRVGVIARGQQEGQIHFHPRSIMAHAGKFQHVLSIKNKETGKPVYRRDELTGQIFYTGGFK